MFYWGGASSYCYCLLLNSPSSPFWFLLFTDQHFHDPPVQLRQRPPGLVHLQKPDDVHPHVDQPEGPDAAACPAGPEILQPVPQRARSTLAGKRSASSAIPLSSYRRQTFTLVFADLFSSAFVCLIFHSYRYWQTVLLLRGQEIAVECSAIKLYQRLESCCCDVTGREQAASFDQYGSVNYCFPLKTPLLRPVGREKRRHVVPCFLFVWLS